MKRDDVPPVKHKIYGTTTMNDKGQIVIPAEARSEIGLEPGSRLMVLRAPFGNAVVVVKTETIEAQMKSWGAALAAPQTDNPSEVTK
jgi:AbrB family looped-hinge helix DNA binding protein